MDKNYEINFNEEKFISLKQTSIISGYAKDYIGQLCRGEKIKAKRIGRDWFVNPDALISYKQGAQSINKTAAVNVNNISEDVWDKILLSENQTPKDKDFSKEELSPLKELNPVIKNEESLIFTEPRTIRASNSNEVNLLKISNPIKSFLKLTLLILTPLIILEFVFIKNPAAVTASLESVKKIVEQTNQQTRFLVQQSFSTASEIKTSLQTSAFLAAVSVQETAIDFKETVQETALNFPNQARSLSLSLLANKSKLQPKF